MTFQAYGRDHHVRPYAFGQYLGLYTSSECAVVEFRSLTNSWPVDMTAQRCWEQFCGEQIKYNPSNSKATLMKDVNLRIAHHLLAHTIGGRKSSHGVVNSFEIFQLYSMATKQPINVGLEVAKYLYRQASDPRSKGIYCGGYVTKFLKGFRIFQEPQNDPGLHCSRITDRPFPSWNLMKLIDQATPPRGLSAPVTPSSSRVPPESDLQKLMKEFKEERELNKKERQKNKRFRASVWKFLGRLATCFTPPPADLPTYESSPEPTSLISERLRRKGKEPAESVSTEEDSDDGGEEETEANASNHESDEEDDDEDSDDGGEEETEANASNDESDEEDDDEDSDDGGEEETEANASSDESDEEDDDEDADDAAAD